MNNLPIKTKEKFVSFAKAYNRFVTFFLINLILGILFMMMLVTNPAENLISILFVSVTIIHVITLILMMIAAVKSRSSYCFTMCIIYFVVLFLIPGLSLIALILTVVAFLQTFKKYNVKVNFYVSQEKMDAIWFCSCGNVCFEEICPNCHHSQNECNEQKTE